MSKQCRPISNAVETGIKQIHHHHSSSHMYHLLNFRMFLVCMFWESSKCVMFLERLKSVCFCKVQRVYILETSMCVIFLESSKCVCFWKVQSMYAFGKVQSLSVFGKFKACVFLEKFKVCMFLESSKCVCFWKVQSEYGFENPTRLRSQWHTIGKIPMLSQLSREVKHNVALTHPCHTGKSCSKFVKFRPVI